MTDPVLRSQPGCVELADEIDQALEQYISANSIEFNRKEDARQALADVLWDNKAGIVAYLRSAGAAALPLPEATGGREAAIEECAKIAEATAKEFLSPQYAANQPFGSTCERFACEEVAKAIRALALPSTVRCTCQEQHRRGYCTEVGCPNAPPSNSGSAGE